MTPEERSAYLEAFGKTAAVLNQLPPLVEGRHSSYFKMHTAWIIAAASVRHNNTPAWRGQRDAWLVAWGF